MNDSYAVFATIEGKSYKWQYKTRSGATKRYFNCAKKIFALMHSHDGEVHVTRHHKPNITEIVSKMEVVRPSATSVRSRPRSVGNR